MAGRTLRGVAPLSAEQSVEKLWRGSPQGESRRGRLRLYELVERRTSGFVFRTTGSGSLTRTEPLASVSSSRRWCTGERRRAKARSGLNGQTVIDRSSVSAFGSSPIRQREVLLARVLLPLCAKSVDRKGSTTGAASATESVFSSGRTQAPESLVIENSRYAQAKLLRSAVPFSARNRAVGRKMGSSAGSTRLMEDALSARGVAAMTESERAPSTISERKGRSARQPLLSAKTGDAGGFGSAPSPAMRWRSRSWQGEGSTPESRIG